MTDTRLIFINRFFSPDHSATAQILSDLTRHLALQGADVHVIASRSLYADPSAVLVAEERIDGATVTRVWTSRFGRSNLLGRAFDYLSFYPTMASALWRLARKGDVVIAKTDPPLLSVVVAPIAAARGVKLVNWLQDLYPEVAIALGMKGLAGPIGRLIRRLRDLSLRAAAANVAIGELMAQRVESAGVDRAKIVTIHNWSDDIAIQPQSVAGEGVRAQWGFEPDDFVVGYSGNLGQAHEVDTLFAAAARLKDYTNIKFLFVGGGRHSEDLKRRADAADLQNFVFRPYQPRERLAQSLATPNIHWLSLRPQMEGLIVPSKFYGVAAAGRGTIVVASKEGELGRLVRARGGGVVIEPGDDRGMAEAVLELSRDVQRCEAMGLQARALLEQEYSKAKALDRWSGLLEKLRLARQP